MAAVASRSRLEPTTLERLDVGHVRRIVEGARAEGRLQLLETEGRELLEAIGIAVPAAAFVPLGTALAADRLRRLRSERVVVRAVADELAHKTELGAVAIVPATTEAVAEAFSGMARRLGDVRPSGHLVAAFVDHPPTIGGELLVSARWLRDHGAIVSIGVGGIHAEALAADLRPDRSLACIATGASDAEVAAILSQTTAVRLATVPQRGQPPLLPLAALVTVVRRLLDFAAACMPHDVLELEINPLAASPAGPVALDILVGVGDPTLDVAPPPRPTAKLRALLEPRSMAIAGVSSGENPGRTILRNVLRDGFDPAAVTVIKPGIDSIDGCRCVPDLASLGGKVDLLVVALAARPAAAFVAEAIERDVAESLLVIPGGLEEKAGGAAAAAQMRSALAAARRRADGGPLVNGGNCLGIRSRPGRYDSLFIPESRLAAPTGHPAPVALLAQSGAFAIARLSRLAGLDPKYVITVGNQMDLTIGDYLTHLAGDPDIEVVGIYTEGLAALDGPRLLAAARRMVARGGSVVLYVGGRTRSGAQASASHTASIAGEAAVTIALARHAGIVVADTLDDFDDLVATFTRLAGRRPSGDRLAALSNAGFEGVAIGDNLGDLTLATLDGATTTRLGAILADAGAGEVVDAHNPVDLTPMAGDTAFAAAAGALLESPAVDVALVSDVPFTPALRTVAADGDDLLAPDAIGPRLVDLWARTAKPWVTVVDAGPRYDPLARLLEAGGIPTFRTVDRAMRALGAFVRSRRDRDQARTGTRTAFSIGAPTRLPHSVHDPS